MLFFCNNFVAKQTTNCGVSMCRTYEEEDDVVEEKNVDGGREADEREVTNQKN